MKWIYLIYNLENFFNIQFYLPFSWVFSSSHFHIIFLFRLLDRWKILIFLRPCHPLPPSRFFLVVIERRIVAEKGCLDTFNVRYSQFSWGKKIFFFLFSFFCAALHAAYRYICMYLYCRKFYLHLTVYIVTVEERIGVFMMPYVIFCKCLFISENGHLAMKCFHSTRRSFDIIIHSLEHINVDSRGRKKSWWRDFCLI